MSEVIALLSRPWPWYVAGPLIGLTVPLLFLAGGRAFGISTSFRQLCAATLPGRVDYFRSYDWRDGAWRLAFVAGIFLGGVLASTVLAPPEPYMVDIAASTRADLEGLGIAGSTGLAPAELFTFSALRTLPGFFAVIVGGFLVGFGTRYAGGCTSGHGITGLATVQPASLLAVIGFFAGGLIATHLFFPLLF